MSVSQRALFEALCLKDEAAAGIRSSAPISPPSAFLRRPVKMTKSLARSPNINDINGFQKLVHLGSVVEVEINVPWQHQRHMQR